MKAICNLLEASLLTGVARAVHMPPDSLRLRIPARHAAASCPLIDAADAGIAAACLQGMNFPAVLGVPPVSAVEAKDGWLLFTLSDEFYTAALREVQRTLPRPEGDLGNHTLNRMLALARAGGDACPADAAVQRAFLLTLCCWQGEGAWQKALRALHGITWHVPPKKRAALAASLGGVADAAARILYDILKARG